jgi:hypothetical protein
VSPPGSSASYLDLGDLDAAEEAARRGADLGADDDVVTQMIVRQVLAKVLAERGEFEEAERLAREAAELGRETDMLSRGEKHRKTSPMSFGSAGRRRKLTARSRTIEDFAAKGALVLADRARRWRPESLTAGRRR